MTYGMFDKISKFLFADDTSLFYSHKDLNTITDVLNEELGKISIWFKSNKLSLNIKKSCFICFGLKPGFPNSSLKIEIDTIPLTNVHYTRFLGILLDESLSWKPHIRAITTKMAKSIGILNKICLLINTEVAIMLYYAMVYPYINYCNIIWASTYQTKLKPIYQLQKRAVRIISCAYQRHSSQPLLLQSGILSVYQVYHLQIG